jgi:hypothetical protein
MAAANIGSANGSFEATSAQILYVTSVVPVGVSEFADFPFIDAVEPMLPSY